MKQVLIFCVQTLAALLKCSFTPDVDRHFVILLSRLLAVIEQIFSWEFAQQSNILYVPIFNILQFTFCIVRKNEHC